MAAENVAFITFDEESKTFQMLAQLKQLSMAGDLRVRNAVVVSHNPDGTLKIEDGTSTDFGMGSSTGGLIGAVVGILGGPLGVLLGWGTGALVGGVLDSRDAVTRMRVINRIGELIPQDKNGLIAEVREESPDALDAAVKSLGGTIVRTSTEAIEDEVEAAAQEEARAKRAARNQQREEEVEGFTDKVKDTWDDFRSKLPGGGGKHEDTGSGTPSQA
ncbi:MAG TPA: DUF1269 domain-containing protein [Thermomicrobiales bacterium]|nr:DUF1269 domain-containing protein [Thermomicrobiales bacterium]